MAITETHTDETYENGKLVISAPRVVDVTTEVVELDLHGKVRAALVGNATFLAIASPTAAQIAAQVKALTRQNNALIRLLIGDDLLGDNAGT